IRDGPARPWPAKGHGAHTGDMRRIIGTIVGAIVAVSLAITSVGSIVATLKTFLIIGLIAMAVIIIVWLVARRPRAAVRRDELGQQWPDPPVDLIADRADSGQVEARGVGQVPVFVALARVDRAGVAAAHGDHHVGGLYVAGGQRLGVFAGNVEADLGHGGYDGRGELVARAWVRAGAPPP